MAKDIALTHHERVDGTGYPRGLKGEQIPLCGRIVALADVYDALTSKRVYKPAYDHETARAIILEATGTHFDKDVVQAFLAREHDFTAVARQFHDGTSCAPLGVLETSEAMLPSSSPLAMAPH